MSKNETIFISRFPHLHALGWLDVYLQGRSGMLVVVKPCVYGVLYYYLVVCAHPGNGTGRRTVTMVAPLLFTSVPVRYEAVLHSFGD